MVANIESFFTCIEIKHTPSDFIVCAPCLYFCGISTFCLLNMMVTGVLKSVIIKWFGIQLLQN